MPRITDSIEIDESELEESFVRASGPGGQNVNKVSSAVHLRFDIAASSLPDAIKQRLLALSDQRITEGGVVVIKAQAHRSQDMNRAEALQRLAQLVDSVARPPKPRRPTRPSVKTTPRSYSLRTLTMFVRMTNPIKIRNPR